MRIAIFFITGILAAQTPEAEVATIVSFTEGPTVDRDGNVYFTETTNQRIMKYSVDGKLSVFREKSNGANGLIFDSQWRLLACERGRVTRTDMKTGRIEVLAESKGDIKLESPNDLTLDNKGRIYFTDLPGGGVYRIDPDGRVVQLLKRPEIQRPNGIAVAPNDRTLYLVEANQAEGGARMIRAYDLAADGSLTKMRVHYNFYPGRSSDGITVDSQGNVWAAAGLNRRRGTSETLDTKCGVHVISPQGKVIRFIPIPEDTLTNLAFGGPDLKTLYVTAGKTLFRIQTGVVGTRR
ncbi:MAG: SMP-30/gluconolactonase/LRE family protein [Bryobacteraceae bacterium]